MSFKIQSNIDLLPYTTFHVSCIAEHFVIVRSVEQVQELVNTDIYTQTTNKLILSGGSNMLLASDRFDGLVIKNEIQGREVVEKTFNEVRICVGAGENRNELVRRTLQQGRVWLENLVSIPGTVGAAPVQNIGAYGAEVKDHILNIEGIDLQTGKLKTMSNEACQFGYRDSIFKRNLKGNFFITSVTLVLKQYDEKTYAPNISYPDVAMKVDELKEIYLELTLPHIVATAVSQIRANKLPDRKKVGTAGSFFQNPIISEKEFEKLQISYPQLKWFPIDVPPGEKGIVKLSGGQLIELAGLKWYTQNGVWTYERHALVLVNHSSTKGSDLLDLITFIQNKVQQLFHVSLYPEVNIIR